MIPKSLDTLRIDINTGKVRKAVSICQQDTVQRTLNFLLVNSGNSVDLSNVLFAEILIHKADGAEADNGCVIDGDSIQYTLRTTDVSALGTNQAQLLLTFADGQTLTTPTFEINVYSKVLNQNVQKSQNEYIALTEQLVLVNEMSNQIGAARDTAIAKATEAEASATAAAESATSANAAKDDVAASASAAAESAGAALSSATLAVSAAGEADTYADNAADSAFEASQSKDNAASSATAAEASASSASTSSYTATQKASEAVDSATAAATSARNAATSENNALNYAERAEAAYEAMGEQQLVLGETSSTAYRGDRGKIAYEHSQTTGNPHNTTAAQVGADVAGAASQAYQQAAGYTDTKIANLINGAPSTLDTLKEIADAMAEHEDVVEALEQAIGTKASDVEFQAHQNNTTVHVTANERTLWNAKQNATDNSLNTTDKTIVGAINEHEDDIAQININLSELLPVGSIFSYSGSTAPNGYLICDGSAISRTDYAKLFSVIGTIYGSGDGSTTFNVPDCRESALVGIGQNATHSIASHDTYTLGQFKDDQLQTHTHGSVLNDYSNYYGSGGQQSGHIGRVGSTGYNTGRSGAVTRGKRLGVNFIIKY